MMSEARSQWATLSQWAEQHPLTFKTLAFVAGVLIFVAYRAVTNRIELWLPAWFPPVLLLTVGFILILQRMRVPVHQDDPETKLFVAILCVALGGAMLISFLMSE